MDDRNGLSVHDNHLVSYEVFCERREIRLHTEFRDRGEPFEFTDVIFTGVACYGFEHDSDIGTIIFDIEEFPATDIYIDQAERLRAGLKYGWPGDWAGSVESATTYFKEHGISGFQLSSSCGMGGWVLAREMRIIPMAPGGRAGPTQA